MYAQMFEYGSRNNIPTGSFEVSDDIRAKVDEIVARNVRWPGWSMTAGDPKPDPEPDPKEDPKDPEPDPEEDPEDPDADKLGDAGKKALDRMKAREREARAALREFSDLGLTAAQVKELKAAADGKKGADGKEVDVEKIRSEAKTAAALEIRDERIDDKIEAKASKFADPEYAKFLIRKSHTSDDFVTASGTIDTDAIEEALSELLTEKPELGAQGAKRFQGGADGGTRKGSKPNQLTQSDLDDMSPQEIKKAKEDGRLNDLLGRK